MASWPARWISAVAKTSNWKGIAAWTRNLKTSSAVPKNLLYINILNNAGRCVQAGVHNINDEGMTKHFLAKAFHSASQNQTSYVSEPLTIELGKETKPVIIMSSPIKSGGKGVGAVTVILKLDDILHWVLENSIAGKTVYVVDFNGLIVVHPDPKTMPAGMDLSRVEIVGVFVDEWRKSKGKLRLQETRPFRVDEDGAGKKDAGDLLRRHRSALGCHRAD